MRIPIVFLALSAVTADAALRAQTPADSTRRARECPDCAAWNAPQKPFRVFGNTYYVGTHGLSSILVTSPRGHALIDGGLPESASLILANIRALGFRPEDVKLIVNSHAHYDHAGGIEALREATGARVAASRWSARVLEAGTSVSGDPQLGLGLPVPPVPSVRTIADGEVLKAGDVALTAHFTGGHTPGGTTWTWKSCEGTQCADFVYADSQTPVSKADFLFTKNTTYPAAIADFEHAFTVLESLSCDILLTPHPGASNLFERVAARDSGGGKVDALVDRDACRRLAKGARQQLAERIAKEKGAGRQR
jgi:metallo-beta-lactamase class B